MLLYDGKFSDITRLKEGKEIQGGYVLMMKQISCEDDGTDRKKKEVRREERKGVLRRVISSKISVTVSDCLCCLTTSTENTDVLRM